MKLAALLSALFATSPQDAVDMKVGEKAPVFTATADDGSEWKSADHVGKKVVVVFFYPAAFTGG